MLNTPKTGLQMLWARWPKLKEVQKLLNGIQATGYEVTSKTFGMDQANSVNSSS